MKFYQYVNNIEHKPCKPYLAWVLQLNFEENALCYNLANFFQNSNFDIAGAEEPSALALAMSKFEF